MAFGPLLGYALLLSALAWFASVSAAMFGPIGTSRPTLAGGSLSNDQPPGPFFQGFKPPFPTDDWWVGFGAGNQDAIAAGPFPYQSRTQADGLQFGISTTRDFDGTSLHQNSLMEWSASFKEHTNVASDHRALGWDSHSVSLRYGQANTSAMDTWLVPGSPYITLSFTNASPKFTSLVGKLTKINAKPVTSGTAVCDSGTKFKIVTERSTYNIYVKTGTLTLCSDSTQSIVASSSKFTGVVRVAKLRDASHESTLDMYAPNYPTGVALDYFFSGNSATLSFKFSVVGDANKLLLLTWPHHRKSLVSPNYLNSTLLSYLTTKGWMYPILGSTWNLAYSLPTIDFNAPRAPDASCKDAIIKGLEFEIGNLGTPPKPGDFYFWGGSVAAASRLALIADQVGRSDLVSPVINWLITTVGYWTDSSYANVQAAYETAWGGVINKAGASNFWVDFGNGYYNDHHFHYGYFLHTCAVIAKFKPSWLTASNGFGTNGDLLSYLTRDIANPSLTGDPYFPLTRHRDWFAGHSWASGIANGAGSRDQESIGEAVNGYYGVLLYATVTGNANLKNYARLLVATEQQAAQVYWHLYPSASSSDPNNAYPEPDVRSLITMGNIQDWQSGAWLFWGDQKVEIAAIQILPVTPINEYMYDAEWVNNVVKYTAEELADPTIDDAWKSSIYQAYGNANPQEAMKMSQSLTAWGTGNSYSNQLYFIATRPNPSGKDICTATSSGPSGTFVLQEVSSNKYVTSSSGRPDLYADSSMSALATTLSINPAVGGSTVMSNKTSQYVTADASGNYALSAQRATASNWEMFAVQLKTGTKDQYTIVARSNKKFVALNSKGALLPTAASEDAAAAFKLLAPPTPAPLPTGTFVLQETSTSKYVSSTSGRPDLYADASGIAAGTSFILGSAQGSTTLQNKDTSQFVTADMSGANPLSAIRAVAQGWEMFTFVLKDGTTDQYIVQAGSNSQFVALNAQGALVPSAGVDGAATFKLVTPAAAPVPVIPSGTFSLQEVASGRYVSSKPDLYSDVTSPALAAAITFVEGKGYANLQSSSTKQYVTADPGGAPLSANRGAAGVWEQFVPYQVAGTTNQYIFLARSNSKYVVLNAAGALVATGATSSVATAFKLAAPVTITLPTGTFVVQDIASGRYVTSTSSRADLYADTSSINSATVFNIAASNGVNTIQNKGTSQFVTADSSGKYVLSAARPTAGAWEQFVLILKDGTSDQYMVLAKSNGKYVAVSGQSSLMPTAASSTDAGVFRLVAPPVVTPFAAGSYKKKRQPDQKARPHSFTNRYTLAEATVALLYKPPTNDVCTYLPFTPASIVYPPPPAAV